MVKPISRANERSSESKIKYLYDNLDWLTMPFKVYLVIGIGIGIGIGKIL
jgi:hypothetical protein